MIELTSIPFRYSFAKNRSTFDFNCQYIDDVGTKTSASFKFWGIGEPNTIIAIIINGTRYDFCQTSENGSYNFTTIHELIECIRDNYYIKEVFEINYTAIHGQPFDDHRLTFTAKTNGPNEIKIIAFQANGIPYPESSFFKEISSYKGLSPKIKKNYGICAAFDITANSSNFPTNSTTQNVVYEPNAKGVIKIPTDIINGYFPAPDIPSDEDPAICITTNLFVKYRLRYAEIFGEPARIQHVEYSPYLYAFQGELHRYYAQNNIPDWDDIEPADQLSNSIFPRIIGEDNHKNVDLFENQHEFLYLFYCNPNKPTTTIGITAEYISSTAVPEKISEQFNVQSGNVYRISIGPSHISMIDQSACRLSLATEGRRFFIRNYRVLPNPYHLHEFLLQNKYGMPIVFIAESILQKNNFTSNIVTIQDKIKSDITKRKQSFIATSALIRKTEAKKIANAIAGDHSYIYNNNRWNEIVIIPNEIIPYDESSDLVKISFEFQYSNNQIDNTSTSTAKANDISSYIADETNNTINQYVVAEQRLKNTEQKNVIL